MSLKKKAQYRNTLNRHAPLFLSWFFSLGGGLGLRWKSHLQLLTLILTFFIFVVVNR